MNKKHLMKFFITTLVIISIVPLNLFAQDINSNAGTSSFPFLKINISARSVAMGGAFTGLADDESSLYYNPAGITSFEEKRFILGYHSMYADMQSGFVGMIKPLSETKAVGFYINYLNYGDFTNTDESGNTLGEFSGGDLLLAGTFAMKSGYTMAFGGTAKFIYEKVDRFSATGIALDLGGKYTSLRKRFGGGIMIQNLGFQLSSLGEEKDKLPLTIRSGIFFKPKGLPVTLATDLIVPVDNDPIIAIGAEYNGSETLMVRVGWNSFGSNYRTSDSEDSWAGIAFGIGLDLKRFVFSYSFTPEAELGESHRITLTGGF